MAINVVAVNNSGRNRRSFDIEATADADTVAAVLHNLPFASDPDANTHMQVVIEPLKAAAYTSQWTVTNRTANNVSLTKGTGAGSGAAGAQIRVHVIRTHSLVE